MGSAGIDFSLAFDAFLNFLSVALGIDLGVG
jgi:hypothetical protein